MNTVSMLVVLCGFGVLQTQTAPTGADKRQLSRLETQYRTSQSAYKTARTPAHKKMLIVATDQLATATMTSELLDARQRYPRALGLYQQVLTLDPSNREAKNNASMIDGVYHGMFAKAQAKLKTNPSDSRAAALVKRITDIYQTIHRPLP